MAERLDGTKEIVEFPPKYEAADLVDGFVLHFVPKDSLRSFFQPTWPDFTIVSRSTYMYPILSNGRCASGVLIGTHPDAGPRGYTDTLACDVATIRSRVADFGSADLTMVRSGSFGAFLIRTEGGRIFVSTDGWTLTEYSDFVKNYQFGE